MSATEYSSLASGLKFDPRKSDPPPLLLPAKPASHLFGKSMLVQVLDARTPDDARELSWRDALKSNLVKGIKQDAAGTLYGETRTVVHDRSHGTVRASSVLNLFANILKSTKPEELAVIKASIDSGTFGRADFSLDIGGRHYRYNVAADSIIDNEVEHAYGEVYLKQLEALVSAHEAMRKGNPDLGGDAGRIAQARNDQYLGELHKLCQEPLTDLHRALLNSTPPNRIRWDGDNQAGALAGRLSRVGSLIGLLSDAQQQSLAAAAKRLFPLPSFVHPADAERITWSLQRYGLLPAPRDEADGSSIGSQSETSVSGTWSASRTPSSASRTTEEQHSRNARTDSESIFLNGSDDDEDVPPPPPPPQYDTHTEHLLGMIERMRDGEAPDQHRDNLLTEIENLKADYDREAEANGSDAADALFEERFEALFELVNTNDIKLPKDIIDPLNALWAPVAPPLTASRHAA